MSFGWRTHPVENCCLDTQQFLGIYELIGVLSLSSFVFAMDPLKTT